MKAPEYPKNPTQKNIDDWEAYCQELFESSGQLTAARAWVATNPPPSEWRYGPLAYAFTEMPDFSNSLWR